MDDQSKIRIKYLRIMTLYAIAVLIALVLFISGNKKTPHATVEQTDTAEVSDTLSEYVYVAPDKPSTEGSVETAEAVYTVKSHMGKIGIFSTDGRLVRVLEVYVKTLPEADIRLLEEGFEVVGQAELNSIIEDYTE